MGVFSVAMVFHRPPRQPRFISSIMRIIHLVTSYHPASCRAITQARLENVGMMVRYGKCGNVGMLWVNEAGKAERVQ